jgi:peptidoglycan/xylan/chitin deacetylase (PgdA/CDA1 family)
MTVDRMVRESAARTLPRRAVAITFDDGYADNLLVAKPLLERHEAPATMYLSPGLLDGHSPFWWDALLSIVLEPDLLPERLEIKLGGTLRVWSLPVDSSLGEHDDWRTWQTPPTIRHDLYLQLWSLIHQLSFAEQREALDELSAWASVSVQAATPDRPLLPEEATRLVAGGLLEIGAHTLTHPSLPALSAECQRWEIQRSKEACEEIAGQRVTTFSYPFGNHTPTTAALVLEAGFDSACTTNPGWLRQGHDHLRLPRIHAHDWDGADLERRLATATLY